MLGIYKILVYFWYIFFALSKLHIWDYADSYLLYVTYYLKIITGLILLYYFNPFYPLQFTKTHKSIAFTAGTFILLSTTFKEFIGNVSSTRKLVKETKL
jgi:hypothetical protein